MTKELILKRSKDIWSWAMKNINKPYKGFYEIRKLEDLVRTYGFKYKKKVVDGGLTIVITHDNGKILAKAREDCYSEGSVLDLIEVYSLYGDKKNVYGFMSADETFSKFLNSYRKYSSEMKMVV